MATESVEERLTRLEQKMSRLENVTRNEAKETRWWERIAGAFKDDLVYVEAMRLAHDERRTVHNRETAE